MQESDEEEAEGLDDETGSEETSPELHDDQADLPSAGLPLAKGSSTMKLRSSTDLDHVAHAKRGSRARKALSMVRAEGEKRAPLKQEAKQEPEGKLILESNPLEWTVNDVVRFIRLTDCAPLAKIFQEQDIDGQALLLLTLPTVQECMDLKLGPAIKLCHQIERVKLAFYTQYAK
ncbi:Scm-like with four MBT domains protein 2 [Varanus komodoensis]|nr:Scm-like with four MBT domains protein 2 [Varanus komodoensis]